MSDQNYADHPDHDKQRPAFPVTAGQQVYTTGMTLRDWFAGQALAGICGDGIPGSHHNPVSTARAAYDYADAMLSTRNESEKKI